MAFSATVWGELIWVCIDGDLISASSGGDDPFMMKLDYTSGLCLDDYASSPVILYDVRMTLCCFSDGNTIRSATKAKIWSRLASGGP